MSEIPDSEKLTKAQLAQGKTPAQVAEFNDISETYAWALKLDTIREDAQRAMVAARVREYHEAKAKERMAKGGGDKRSTEAKRAASGKENLPSPIKEGQARDLAGQAVGVSGACRRFRGRLLTRPTGWR